MFSLDASERFSQTSLSLELTVDTLLDTSHSVSQNYSLSSHEQKKRSTKYILFSVKILTLK